MTVKVLDPFLLNLLPRTLLPTGIYIILIAIVGWYLSRIIWDGLNQLARVHPEGKKTE